MQEWGETIRGTWEHFGGDKGPQDDRLRQHPDWEPIAALLIAICTFAAGFLRSRQLEQFQLTVLCAWGKHRSRLQIRDLRDYLLGLMPSNFQVREYHLSTRNRKLEVAKFKDLKNREHYNGYQALQIAKRSGHRTNRDTWPNIKSDMRRLLGDASYCNCGTDNMDLFLVRCKQKIQQMVDASVGTRRYWQPGVLMLKEQIQSDDEEPQPSHPPRPEVRLVPRRAFGALAAELENFQGYEHCTLLQDADAADRFIPKRKSQGSDNASAYDGGSLIGPGASSAGDSTRTPAHHKSSRTEPKPGADNASAYDGASLIGPGASSAGSSTGTPAHHKSSRPYDPHGGAKKMPKPGVSSGSSVVGPSGSRVSSHSPPRASSLIGPITRASSPSASMNKGSAGRRQHTRSSGILAASSVGSARPSGVQASRTIGGKTTGAFSDSHYDDRYSVIGPGADVASEATESDASIISIDESSSNKLDLANDGEACTIVVADLQGAPAEVLMNDQLQKNNAVITASCKMQEPGAGNSSHLAAVTISIPLEAHACPSTAQARVAMDKWDKQQLEPLLGAIQAAAKAALNMSISTDTVDTWRPMLTDMADRRYTVIEALYACAIIQAVGVLCLEPVFLLTPAVMTQVHALPRLRECALLDAAKQTLRMFWVASHERELHDDLWKVLPWCGIAPSKVAVSPDQESWSSVMLFCIFGRAEREQFATISDWKFAWQPKRPPYVDTYHLMIRPQTENVQPCVALPPLSLLYSSTEVRAKHDKLIVDCCCLELTVSFRDEDLWRQLLMHDIVAFMHSSTDLDYAPGELPLHERWKLILFIGNRVKNVLKLDRNLHWQLRQGLESYLGHMLYSLYYMHSFGADVTWSKAKQLCMGAGIIFQPGLQIDPRNFWDMMDASKDKQLSDAFDGQRLGQICIYC